MNKNPPLKIGVIGFSHNLFDKKEARVKLEALLSGLLEIYPVETIELVSGYTSSGMPEIAYHLADFYGISTTGFSARQALKAKSGVYPVKKVILVGEKFGEESHAFIEYIDVLIRIGGGSQSLHEVDLFKAKNISKDLSGILFEEEVRRFG